MSTRIGLVGDFLIQHRISPWQDEDFIGVAEILRGTDATIANLECTIFDGEDWPTFATGQGRCGTPMAAAPRSLDEARWLGIDMVATANNHSSDFGEGGVLRTNRYLDVAGIPHAGSGASLTEASAPAYLDTPGGRVALVACSDWGPRGNGDLAFPWPMGVMAADGDGFFPSRPGLNLLRYDCNITVPAAEIDGLRRISELMRWEEAKDERNRGGARILPVTGQSVLDSEVDTDDCFHFMGRKFIPGDKPGIDTVAWTDDVARNLKWIREARARADIVVVAMHCHAPVTDPLRRSGLSRDFSRQAIDAGADIFVCIGGAGWTGGVEFYKGKAIVYGVSTICHQNEQITKVPLEHRLRSGLGSDATPSEFLAGRLAGQAGKSVDVLPGDKDVPRAFYVIDFAESGEIERVILHPFEEILAPSVKQHVGLPRLLEAGSTLGQQTLEKMRSIMDGLGTTMTIKEAVGEILP